MVLKGGDLNEMLSFSNEVSMFAITELCGKITPMSFFTLRLIDNLKPFNFVNVAPEHQELEFLKMAQMKVSNKVIQHGYDLVSFMTRLDIHKNGMLHLHELFTELASQLNIYFSQYEQVAIHNVLFPS